MFLKILHTWNKNANSSKEIFIHEGIVFYLVVHCLCQHLFFFLFFETHHCISLYTRTSSLSHLSYKAARFLLCKKSCKITTGRQTKLWIEGIESPGWHWGISQFSIHSLSFLCWVLFFKDEITIRVYKLHGQSAYKSKEDNTLFNFMWNNIIKKIKRVHQILSTLVIIIIISEL